MSEEKKKPAAKKAAKKKAASKGRGSNLPKFEAPKFGVEALAKELGVTPMTARMKLRDAGIEKDGRSYDFKSADGVKKIAKKIGSEKKAA